MERNAEVEEGGTSPVEDPAGLARTTRRRVSEAPDRRVPTLRSIRRGVSREVRGWTGGRVLELADRLLTDGLAPRWLAYEVVHHHAGARALLDADALEALGEGMASWGEVDPFGILLAGVVWAEGGIDDAVVRRWARSPDRWWRRAALVSTVALNRTAEGGEARRTLAVCDLLVDDRDDMVVKAMSWALRALVKVDRRAVEAYLRAHGDALAARVRREVRNKLDTGLKNPPRGARGS